MGEGVFEGGAAGWRGAECRVGWHGTGFAYMSRWGLGKGGCWVLAWHGMGQEGWGRGLGGQGMLGAVAGGGWGWHGMGSMKVWWWNSVVVETVEGHLAGGQVCWVYGVGRA